MEAKISTAESENEARAAERAKGHIQLLKAPGKQEPILPEPEREIEVQSPRGDRETAFTTRVATWGDLLLRGSVVAVSIVLLVLAWWAVAVFGGYPAFILPTPLDVAQRTWSMLLDGSLLMHAGTTIAEAGLGFVLALAVGVAFGYIIGHSRLLEKFLSPYIAVSQGLPVVALAPLLAIWFKDDLIRKVVIVALIVFFPILVNSIVAVRSIDRSMYEVARISGANLWQQIRYVELPLGLRSLLAGVKLGLTLAITGAVIGEFVSAQAGLGFLLTLGRGIFDTTLVFVGLVSLAVLTIVAYSLVSVLERALITWE